MFLHLNSISRKWSARAFRGVGMMVRSIYFFFHLSRRYHELFSLSLQGRHYRGVVEYWRNVKETNIIIMEYDISYFEAKRELSLINQWFVFLFSVNLAPLTFSSLEPCLHLKLHGSPLVLFSVNIAPLTFSSLEPLLALETAWRISRPFLRQLGAHDVFFPGAPACTWNCMAHLSSFSPSIWRPWRFLPWSPCLHLKLHGSPLVLFSVNIAPLTFSSLEPLLALETAWRISRPFLRQFGAHDVFFPGAPACTWNCMAPLSSFSPSIWRPWRFLPWSPCLHLKLHGTPLVLFSVNLAPLTFSSLEPLLALETAWRISRPPSIWLPWRFLPWSPCLHLKLHGAHLVLFSVNLAPLTFSSLEPLLALETAWRPSRPFLRQFGAPDVFFPGAPACTWNCMAALSSFSPSISRPWRFLPWSPCLHLKLHGASLVLFSVKLAPLTFSSL